MVVTLPQTELRSQPPGTLVACGEGPGPQALSSPGPLAPTQHSVHLAVMNGCSFDEGLRGGEEGAQRRAGWEREPPPQARPLAAGCLSVSAQASVLCLCKESAGGL